LSLVGQKYSSQIPVWRARAPFDGGELVEDRVDADPAKRPACGRNKVRSGREGYFALTMKDGYGADRGVVPEAAP
jgi:hypothetical protein